MLIRLIKFCIQSHTSPKLQTWSLRKGCNWFFDTLGVSLEGEPMNSVPALESWRTWNSKKEMFVIWARFDFTIRVSPNQLAWFIPSKSQPKLFYLCWTISLIVIGFFHAVESWWTKNARKCCLSWHAKISKLICFQNNRLDVFRQGRNQNV